jgi:hypothetical protein
LYRYAVGEFKRATPAGKHVIFNPSKGVTAAGVYAGGVADPETGGGCTSSRIQLTTHSFKAPGFNQPLNL